MALLLLFKVISFTSFLNLDLWAWFFGQITIFQYYTPNLLRNFGVGTPNGSLWTIPVELEFYILLHYCPKKFSWTYFKLLNINVLRDYIFFEI